MQDLNYDIVTFYEFLEINFQSKIDSAIFPSFIGRTFSFIDNQIASKEKMVKHIGWSVYFYPNTKFKLLG